MCVQEMETAVISEGVCETALGSSVAVDEAEVGLDSIDCAASGFNEQLHNSGQKEIIDIRTTTLKSLCIAFVARQDNLIAALVFCRAFRYSACPPLKIR